LAWTSGRADGWVDTDNSQIIEVYVEQTPTSWGLYVSGFRFSM
jgi:hypothetical protein